MCRPQRWVWHGSGRSLVARRTAKPTVPPGSTAIKWGGENFAYLARPDRLIALRDMAGLMAETTEDQASELGEEYAAIREALPLRPLFIMAAARRELITPNGMRLTPEIARELSGVQKLRDCAEFLEGAVAAVRLVQIDTQADGRTSIAIRVEVRRQGGEWESLGGFIQVPPLRK